MTAGEQTSPTYKPGLDGLRALSVACVMLYHLNPVWLPGGFMGVTVFFVLSGYLITDLLLAEWRRNGRIRLSLFWVKRFRRLLPAMLTMMMLVSIWMAVFRYSDARTLGEEGIAALFYVYNWWQIYHEVSYFEQFGPASPFTHMWSLAVEEQFYLLWPLALILLLRLAPRRITLLLALGAGIVVSASVMAFFYEPGLDPSRVYFGTDTRAFSLWIGAGLAVILPSGSFRSDSSNRKKIALDAFGLLGLLLLAASCFIPGGQYDAGLYPSGMLLTSFAAAFVIASAAHPSTWLGRALGWRPLCWAGVRSYGMYLWHYPLLALSPAWLAEAGDGWRAASILALTTVLSAWSYRFVEQPIRRGRFTIRTWFGGELTSRQLAYALCIVCLLGMTAGGLGDKHAAATPVWASAKPPGFPVASPSMPERRGQEGTGDLSPNKAYVPETFSTEPALPVTSDQENRHEPVPSSPSDTMLPASRDMPQGEMKQSTSAEGEKAAAPSPHFPDEAPKDSPSDTPVPSSNKPESKKQVTAIGDSIMLELVEGLQQVWPGAVVDGKIGRQMAQAGELVAQLKEQGKLGGIVILELGTNGSFTESTMRSLLGLIGEDREVYLVNTRVSRPWQDQVNAMLAAMAGDYEHVHLVDWHAFSGNHPNFFSEDGVHPNAEGAKAYTAMLLDAIGR